MENVGHIVKSYLERVAQEKQFISRKTKTIEIVKPSSYSTPYEGYITTDGEIIFSLNPNYDHIALAEAIIDELDLTKKRLTNPVWYFLNDLGWIRISNLKNINPYDLSGGHKPDTLLAEMAQNQEQLLRRVMNKIAYPFGFVEIDAPGNHWIGDYDLFVKYGFKAKQTSEIKPFYR